MAVTSKVCYCRLMSTALAYPVNDDTYPFAANDNGLSYSKTLNNRLLPSKLSPSLRRPLWRGLLWRYNLIFLYLKRVSHRWG